MSSAWQMDLLVRDRAQQNSGPGPSNPRKRSPPSRSPSPRRRRSPPAADSQNVTRNVDANREPDKRDRLSTLPADIRVMIYTELFRSYDVGVHLIDLKPARMAREANTSSIDKRRNHDFGVRNSDARRNQAFNDQSAECLNLLLASRAIHNEAYPVFLKETNFVTAHCTSCWSESKDQAEKAGYFGDRKRAGYVGDRRLPPIRKLSFNTIHFCQEAAIDRLPDLISSSSNADSAFPRLDKLTLTQYRTPNPGPGDWKCWTLSAIEKAMRLAKEVQFGVLPSGFTNTSSPRICVVTAVQSGKKDRCKLYVSGMLGKDIQDVVIQLVEMKLFSRKIEVFVQKTYPRMGAMRFVEASELRCIKW